MRYSVPRTGKKTKVDPILPWWQVLGIVLGAGLGVFTQALPLSYALLTATSGSFILFTVLLYLEARSLRCSRDIHHTLRESAEYHEQALHLKYQAVCGVAKTQRQDLNTKQGVIDDLMDQIQDLQVVAAKVGTQKALIESLQRRIENLNYLIQNGTERRSGTTLKDVYELTGEAGVNDGVQPPTFKELEDQLEEQDDD